MEKKKSSMHLQFSQNCLLNYKLLVRDERIYFIDPSIRRNTVINKSGINGKRIEERGKGIFKKRLSSTVKLVGRERWIDQIKERHCRRRVKKKNLFFSPDIVKLWIRAYSQRLRVRSHSVQFPMGVEFRASYGLDVLERRHGDESWPSAVAASVAGIEFRPRFLLRTRSKSKSIRIIVSKRKKSRCDLKRFKKKI